MATKRHFARSISTISQLFVVSAETILINGSKIEQISHVIHQYIEYIDYAPIAQKNHPTLAYITMRSSI